MINRLSVLVRLALSSAWSRRSSLLLLLFSVAISACLLLSIDMVRQSARQSFTHAVSGTDLIVGARTSPVSLLLYSIFRIGDATQNMHYTSFEALQADKRVAWALPISLGDSFHGFSVVGTHSQYFSVFQYGLRKHLYLAQGRPFLDYKTGDPTARLFEAVIGADVAKQLGSKVGDRIVLSHGMPLGGLGKGVLSASHADKPFTVVGILNPTGTPVDRSVHVSLEGIEAIHLNWQAGVPLAGSSIPLALVPKFDLTPKAITAVLVGLKSRTSVFNMQRSLNTQSDEALSAILPGVALSDLWQMLSVAENALFFVAFLVGLVSALGLVCVLLVTLEQRRRELAVLRSLGARPMLIMSLLVLEAALIMCLGALLGVAFCALMGFLTQEWLLNTFGFVLNPVWQAKVGLIQVAIFVVFGCLLACVPAGIAYRQQVRDGLSPKI